MKLENWGDLFKYTRELLDDDYNHGQALVVNTKSKGADNITVSLKVSLKYLHRNAAAPTSKVFLMSVEIQRLHSKLSSRALLTVPHTRVLSSKTDLAATKPNYLFSRYLIITYLSLLLEIH